MYGMYIKMVLKIVTQNYIIGTFQAMFNPLNPELNPICYLLALLGAHYFLHVSRIRVKLLTFRLLMSYIYIWSTHS
jgi:transposase